MSPMTIKQIEQLARHFTVNDVTGCWDWFGAKTRTGYSTYYVHGIRQTSAHKILYEELFGSTPRGSHLDHLCRDRLCVNPLHLEVVSARVNILRGAGLAAVNFAKTHCIHGHEFTENNIYRRRDRPRDRICRKCINIRSREHYRKRAKNVLN